ncbi:MAG: HEAT repeat domain-containing protein [Candidatus Cyclobacteriaceae bacterium M2_1C_046]
MDREGLLKKYREGKLADHNLLLLEELIEKGEIMPEDLEDHQVWLQRSEKIKVLEPSENLDDKFYDWLNEEQESASFAAKIPAVYHINWWQAAAAAIFFICGVGAGLLFMLGNNKHEEQLLQITQEMQQMQEIMMFTLLKEGSTSDRLKAVSYSSDIPQLSEKIIKELLFTLNNDENINVRLATVEALARYTNNPEVREGLIRSIDQQTSPLVQMALVELMVAIREKKSVEELKGLLRKNNITPEVKSKVEEGLNILI